VASRTATEDDIPDTEPDLVPSLDDLLLRFDEGSKRAAARLISIVEEGRPEALAILDRLYPRVGNAIRVGVTGPPGAGKSTLADRLVELLVQAGEKPGIVAVDPTSPFTGGALLGDRVRMGPVANHADVFFRSLGSRGSLGGLSLHTAEVADVLDAFGCTWLLLETVGVGQSELDVAQKAHSTLVVLVPESGDGIQAMKAGLMEIADIFVVNKADRAGAEKLQEEILLSIDLKEWRGWRPPVFLTEARGGRGVDELHQALLAHRRWLEEHGMLQQKRRQALESRVRDLVEDVLHRELWQSGTLLQSLRDGLDTIERDGGGSPYRLARALVEQGRAALSVRRELERGNPREPKG
jgi:LAO/AO transport system kinase